MARESRFTFGSDPDIFEDKSGGGCLAVFGLPFLLAGLFVMQIPFGFLPFEGEESGPPGFVLVLFGAPFVLVGGGLMFGRSGITIDRRRGILTKWWGLVVPMKRTEALLDTFDRVRLSYHAGDSDSAATFPVDLIPRDATKPLPVRRPTDYAEARRLAEGLAKFLIRPLEDLSTGKQIVREPAHLDESLRERIRRTGEDVRSLPPPPAGMRTTCVETSDGVSLEIPGPLTNRLRLIPLVFAGIFAAVAGYIILMLLALPGPPAVRYGFSAFIFLFLIVTPVFSVVTHLRKASRQKTVVTATPSLLKVVESYGAKKKTAEIPAGQIEDLAVPTTRSRLEAMEMPQGKRLIGLGDTGTPRMADGRPVPRFVLSILRHTGSPGITVRSDTVTVTFGIGLPEEEAVYLHALLLRVLAG